MAAVELAEVVVVTARKVLPVLQVVLSMLLVDKVLKQVVNLVLVNRVLVAVEDVSSQVSQV